VAHGVKHAAQGAEQLISQGEAHRTIAPSPGFSFDGSFDAPTLFITGYFHAVFHRVLLDSMREKVLRHLHGEPFRIR
jgi:hypothetical protein